MKSFCLAFAALALALPARAGKLEVVATTPDLGAIAREIGGDHITVADLAKPTEDPHFVDAKPSLVVKLNHADAVIEGGAELELGWLPALLDNARNSKLDTGKPGRILASEGLVLLEVPATLDRSRGDVHAAGNPHYMNDPLNGRVVAEHLCNAFSQLDPASAAYFRANLKKFEEQLDAKLAQWQALLAPYKGRDVVSYHNYWPYFAQRFGLKMELFLEPKPGIPPTPAHLAEVITKMKADNVRVIVVQPYQNRKTAETVAGHTDALVLDFPSFPAAGQTYAEWMDGLVKSLVKAFEARKQVN
ncbi:MAG: metal ABC transporter substrate-binding protein [Verrucomicrobiota bacterium]|jgi:zinc/manganese transport system substrate-binding protein